ncbi:MAG: TonB-dependent receptor [Bacteroidaceae bacterium]|nr:TonB-dependent receptor [Bacteroidaceae bacterium]
MTKKLALAAFLFGVMPLGFAQTPATEKTSEEDDALKQDNAAFVFTESQLGEDDDVTQNVIMVNSNNNVYTSNAGYLFSPARYKFRAYNSRYNDIYFNGVQVNNPENGQFNYSTIGGINDATRSIDASSVFEANTFSMANIAGSSNYNFRAGNYAAGQKVTLSGANRNYTARAMYTFGTGITKRGWAFFGTMGYRWSNMNTAAVEGTFYNSLSYFMAVQKKWGDHHALNLATWGNPTERAQQGASTDEAYWLANDYLYNPYWGYQDGKKRSSRVVNNYEPTAMLTWDYKINNRMKLTTSLLGKYVMYSSTKLNYSGTNPHPDYWKNFPSYNFNVWGDTAPTEAEFDAWQDSYDYWTASKRNRQIDFDQLYFANQQLNASGHDAIYYIEKKHNNHLNFSLGSTFDYTIDKSTKLQTGLQLSTNKGMHYQTMHDLLGGQYFHNINTYAQGTYADGANETYYDLNNKYGQVKEGDRFRYDYNLMQQNAKLWATWTKDKGISHNFVSAKIGGSQMWRDGRMNNGIFANYTDGEGKTVNLSYGKSEKARFLDGGFKMGTNLNLGRGNAISFGAGYETRAPFANTAFVSPEMNNNFVRNLTNERIFSSELGYALNCKWLQMNITGYFTHTFDGTEWQQFYNDNENSFTYNSLYGVEKYYYGAELGMKFKVTSNFSINLLGSIAESKYAKNTNATYMLSNEGKEKNTICFNKGMRESGTPLAAVSLGLRYSVKGWYFNLNGNYYDRIYLSYSPNMRYNNAMLDLLNSSANADGSLGYITTEADGSQLAHPTEAATTQAKGKGGFMLDGSIGHSFRVAGHPLNVNLMVTNITNNRKLCTGGYEQSRSTNYTTAEGGEVNRTYNFQKNPKKFYAQGINFMLNLNYRF